MNQANQGVLLADYFKAIVTGNGIPSDLNTRASGSPFYKQYNNANPNGMNDPAALPGTGIQFAFDPQSQTKGVIRNATRFCLRLFPMGRLRR